MRNILKFLILRISLALVTNHFEALNISCINTTYLTETTSDTVIYVNLPTFYRATLNVDLRHLDSSDALTGVALNVFLSNTDTNNTYSQNLPLSLSATSYNLFAANNLVVNASFSITGNSTEEVVGKSYLFSKSVSFTIVEANPQGQVQQSFLFLVTSANLISLPYNMISNENVNNFNGYFISQVNSLGSLYSRQASVPSYSDYWNGLQSVALPYLPYLSNCQNQGDYIYFSQLIHNESYCQLYGNKAVPINEFSFGSIATADNCQFTTKCVYDEIPSVSNQYPFWNTLGTVNQVPFSVTATQQSQDALLANFDATQLVPCQIKQTSGTNSSDMYPLKVSMSFGYYQQTNDKRRMITCEIQFSLYAASSANFTYELDINIFPLSHTQILLNFGFKWYIYMLVFIIIGLISNFQFVIFWCYHLIVTIKQKRNFNIKIYLRLQRQILKGVIPAGVISVLITFMVQIIMNGTFFGNNLFPNFSSFWNYMIQNYIGYFASNIQNSTQSGRMGFSNVIISSYLIIVLSDYLIGKQRKKQEYEVYQILGRKFKPQQWNRGKLIFVTYAYIFFSIYFLYFTYTSVFGEQIWFIIAFMQAFQMVIQEVAYSVFDDKLPCTPLKLALGVLAYLATMGAIDLYYFILGYLVDVGISIIQITYLSQLQQSIKMFIEQKNEEINKFYRNLLNDEEDEQQNKSKGEETQFKNDEILINEQLNQINFLEKQIDEEHNFIQVSEIKIYDEDEQIKKRFLEYMIQNEKSQQKQHKTKGSVFIINEQLEKQKNQFQNKKFQLIIDGATGMTQYLIQPIIIFILWITYKTSTVLSNFQISYQNAILYLLSSVILALFFQINIIIIFHVLELYLNTDYDVQFKELLGRFQNKTTFWITDEEKIDPKMQIKLRGIHSYSISSQLFFVTALYTISIYLFINGVMTIISSSYNMFKDPYIIFIFIFWIIILQFLNWFLKKIATIFDIWGYASLSEEKRSQTKFDEEYSAFEQETNQILKKEELINSSTIKFTFKRINDPMDKLDQDFEEEKRKILESKLATICKKLEPQFDKEDFRLNFARKNKEFIKQNIQKILPLVKSFPSDDIAWTGKGSVVNTKDMKKEYKNCDPMISDFLANWIKRVEANRAKRQQEGIEHERKLKKCRFCFKTWGLYYGYDGICLECSDKLFQLRKDQFKKTK